MGVCQSCCSLDLPTNSRTSLDTGTIGPVTAMTAYTESFGPLTSTLHGVVVSAILLGGSFSGLFSGNIADIYGRVRTIQVGALIFGIGAAIEASSFKLGQFIAGRIITGFGEGLFLGTCVVYICEIAPTRRRGPLSSILQFLLVVGIAAGYFLSFATTRIPHSSLSWRLPLAFHSLVSFTFALLSFTLPPSPRWLLAKGLRDEAIATLERLGLASSELEEMATAPSSEDASLAQRTLWTSIRHNVRDMGKVFAPAARKQTALACFIMAMQQFSGIDGVLYYAPLLFQQAGLATEEASFLASGVSALVMLAVTIPASIYSDHWGRRTSVITGGMVLASCMLLIGSLYASKSVHGGYGVARWVVVVTIYVFAVAFSVTWAICMKLYSSEIQPLSTRASGTNLAQSVNWVSPPPSDLLLVEQLETDACTRLQTGSSLSRLQSSLRVRRLRHTTSSASRPCSRSLRAHFSCRRPKAGVWRRSTRHSTSLGAESSRLGA